MIDSSSPLLSGFAELADFVGLPSASLRHVALCHSLPIRAQRAGKTWLFDAGDAALYKAHVNRRRARSSRG